MGVHHDDDRAKLERTEQSCGEVRAVREGDYYALFSLNSRYSLKNVCETVGLLLNLVVGPVIFVGPEGDTITQALLDSII